MTQTKDNPEWRANIHKTLEYFNMDWQMGLPIAVINAIDAAYVAGLEDGGKVEISGSPEPKELKELMEGFGKEFAAYSNHERLDKESFISWAEKFIAQVYKVGQVVERERLREAYKSLQILEYPKMKKVSCEQAYIGGQMNMLMRFKAIADISQVLKEAKEW